jgi:nicotinamidase-related amidase
MLGGASRDPVTDHLLTPQNALLAVIDYQPSQVSGVRSMDREALLTNIVCVARIAMTFQLPVVLSTVNVAHGQLPTIPEVKAMLPDSVEIDRTQINPWENLEFRAAVVAAGRKKLVMTALWTEVCLVLAALDAMRDGFEVYPIVDAVAGTSEPAHQAALDRMVQAGAQPITWISMALELQRDWARTETVADLVDITRTLPTTGGGRPCA